jgi:hypothetical protein
MAQEALVTNYTIAIINGNTYNLAQNSSSGKWEATITAPSISSYNEADHYYDVTLQHANSAGTTVTVDSTDSTLGSSLQLVVQEKVAPTISITAPTSGATLTSNKPTISFTVSDADSGVNPDTISIKIDSGTAITSFTKTASGKNYTCSYTPTTALSDGSHTITINASDYDGNAATAATVTFKIDTVPPTLSVTTPTDNLITNNKTVTVSGTTNDVTSSPVTLTVNGSSVTVGSDGAFSTTVTLSEGTNTITVVATDGAGKTTTVTRTVTLDTSVPVIKSVTITPNPVDAGKTFVISVEIED